MDVGGSTHLATLTNRLLASQDRVTRSLLWQEHRTEHADGYGYAWFCEHYQAWKGRVSPTLRRRDGVCDDSGDTIDLIDPTTRGCSAS
ncbi:MAG: Integrase catalytic region [Phenylobacterium sp.]|nr:Integrase catalytic region [Phenylobacterium sp.]